MTQFRVLVYAQSPAFIIAYSEPTDYVSASQTARFLRHLGHSAAPLPNTKPLDRQAIEWDRTSPAGLVKIRTCNCGCDKCNGVAVHVPANLRPTKAEEPCDGK